MVDGGGGREGSKGSGTGSGVGSKESSDMEGLGVSEKSCGRRPRNF